MARPEDADAIVEGHWPYDTDRVLVSFDDGWDSNFAAAEWLARIGVSAVFFVVPALIGRTPTEYLRFHERFNVRADVPLATPGARGLSANQLREMKAMGHRIGAHNFGHRDWGASTPCPTFVTRWTTPSTSSESPRRSCRDFAIAFGQPFNVSEEAIAHLKAGALRVSACPEGSTSRA